MNIFGWGEQGRKELKEIIVKNEKLITQLRDEKIEAQISESRAQSGFNAQKESDRAQHEVEIAQLNRKIETFDSDFSKNVTSFKNACELDYQKKIAEARAIVRRELRTENGVELDTLKKANKTLTDESSNNKGLYSGALLVIKALEGQLKNVNELNADLLKNLPTVSAQITTPSVTVGSNNKVS